MCVPTVQQAFEEIAHFHPWPTCNMSNGSTSNTAWQWATQDTCPPFYSVYNQENGAWQSCTYPGVVNVTVDGYGWWETIFVNPYTGDTSTDYSDSARTALTQDGGTIDPTYDNDKAAYVPPAPPPCNDCGGGGT
jgi:hypothetical protein